MSGGAFSAPPEVLLSQALSIVTELVQQAREAIARRDWEAAHAAEDSAHVLIVRYAAHGLPVQVLAAVLVPLCDTEYPRHCA